MRPHLTMEQRQLALRLKARGLSLREIGPQVGCSHQGVALIVRCFPAAGPSRWLGARAGAAARGRS
ncbi:helix-turn-helix domain-containing protein [Actinoallomurus sp. CA-150999]|uniref:helix-turn-helix domain-containing protein n=1 Tax=Actinoallomurus sp. CA-150999 TaxID=3239887 RepID=UPI003D8BBAFB